MSVGHSPDEPRYTPDMRKSEQDITEADKKEAKRRIQGNFAMEEESPEGSGDDNFISKKRLSKTVTMDTLKASAM